jgi:hypothetical protein
VDLLSGHHGLGARVASPRGNPLLEVRNDRIGQLAAWRHLKMRIGIPKRCSSRLSDGLPGTMAGPSFPPFSNPVFVSSASSPFGAASFDE